MMFFTKQGFFPSFDSADSETILVGGCNKIAKFY